MIIHLKILEQKIDELKRLIISYALDELSLQDLVSMDETFSDLFVDLLELKEEIVDRRFEDSLDLCSQGF